MCCASASGVKAEGPVALRPNGREGGSCANNQAKGGTSRVSDLFGIMHCRVMAERIALVTARTVSYCVFVQQVAREKPEPCGKLWGLP